MATKLEIVFDMGALPEGWEGNPNDLLQMAAELLTGEVEGDFPTGIVGTAKPTENVGVWYNTAEFEIEFYNEEKSHYEPIRNVPVGAILDWAVAPNVPVPPNFVEATGALLQKEDYPDLAFVYGTVWGTPPNSESFYIPNTSGRSSVGAGTGKYAPDGAVAPSGGGGTMAPRSVGQYFGSESIQKGTKPPGATGLMQLLSQNANIIKSKGTAIASVLSPSYGVRKIIRYR